ncbi:sulfite reductase beta subunit-like hemoprotein [Clostridium saccharobutylicum]|nr:sulfite reductase beta subunit-like hemoprotein [Clostridium saccharobutylicum]NYC31301.1 sulfite reductase beta subunit-like hemoprotein [Clostridium saccharobutylicum]
MNLSLLMQLWEFKSFSAIMGIYKERLIETYMIRPRIPGGCITLKQLKAISEIAKNMEAIKYVLQQDRIFNFIP